MKFHIKQYGDRDSSFFSLSKRIEDGVSSITNKKVKITLEYHCWTDDSKQWRFIHVTNAKRICVQQIY